MYNESILEFEVGGETAITQFDQFNIDNTTILNGQLNVSLINGYVPDPGAGVIYDIIRSATPLIGTFDAVSLPASLGILYSSDIVSLIAGLPGDLNGDGFVGIDDLNIVLANWNGNTTAGVWSDGDPSGDGFIGIDDLNTVLSNWNNGTPPPLENANIPEPTAIVLICLGTPALLNRSQRRPRLIH